jgi:hypothetical protein
MLELKCWYQLVEVEVVKLSSDEVGEDPWIGKVMMLPVNVLGRWEQGL